MVLLLAYLFVSLVVTGPVLVKGNSLLVGNMLVGNILMGSTMLAHASFSSPISILGPALVEAVYRWDLSQQSNLLSTDFNCKENRWKMAQERSSEPPLERRHHSCLDCHQTSIENFFYQKLLIRKVSSDCQILADSHVFISAWFCLEIYCIFSRR